MDNKLLVQIQEYHKQLTVGQQADCEGGARALRSDAKRHGVDLHNEKELEAFLLGLGWAYLAFANYVDDARKTRAVGAISVWFKEDSIGTQGIA